MEKKRIDFTTLMGAWDTCHECSKFAPPGFCTPDTCPLWASLEDVGDTAGTWLEKARNCKHLCIEDALICGHPDPKTPIVCSRDTCPLPGDSSEEVGISPPYHSDRYKKATQTPDEPDRKDGGENDE